MKKLMFFDFHELEHAGGFRRELEPPTKHPDAPLMTPDEPWEYGNMQLYGSVIRCADGRFRAWYNFVNPERTYRIGYAESDDGLAWRKPALDVYAHDGVPTNIVFPERNEGPGFIEDLSEPRAEWRYKMLCGVLPSMCITGLCSPDGIHWAPAAMGFHGRPRPAMAFESDAPTGLLRRPDGRYVAYHRVAGFGRRIFRSESWDFINWTAEPQMVIEPGPDDPPQMQLYGFGVTNYGPYEIGTLWMYATDADDWSRSKMMGLQYPEFCYARAGTAWHRAQPGTAFIPNGGPAAWDRGNLQPASQPVFLEDEIRYYYAGTDARHSSGWERQPQNAGMGLASLKPDRFVALRADDAPAELLTVAFEPPSAEVFVNARTESGGEIRVELLDEEAQPLDGFSAEDCRPIAGDDTAHRVEWRGAGQAAAPVGRPTRMRLTARNASVYAVFVTDAGETPVYHQFDPLGP